MTITAEVAARRVEEMKVRHWNRFYPPGTEVRFWLGAYRRGRGEAGFTKSGAFLHDAGPAVLFVCGRDAPVSLSLVEPLRADSDDDGAPAEVE